MSVEMIPPQLRLQMKMQPEGWMPCILVRPRACGLVKLLLGSWQQLLDNKWTLFSATEFVIICRKIICALENLCVNMSCEIIFGIEYMYMCVDLHFTQMSLPFFSG